LRYLHGTIGYGLRCVSNGELELHRFIASDWAGSSQDRNNTLGCCFSFGSTMISWMIMKKTYIALSTVEVEYIVACLVSCEVVWLRNLLVGLFDLVLEPIVIYCDNQSCMKLYEDLVFHDRSKHIEIKIYIHSIIQKGAVRLQHISIDEQVDDILRNPLPRWSSFTSKIGLGLLRIPPLVKGSVDVVAIICRESPLGHGAWPGNHGLWLGRLAWISPLNHWV